MVRGRHTSRLKGGTILHDRCTGDCQHRLTIRLLSITRNPRQNSCAINCQFLDKSNVNRDDRQWWVAISKISRRLRFLFQKRKEKRTHSTCSEKKRTWSHEPLRNRRWNNGSTRQQRTRVMTTVLLVDYLPTEFTINSDQYCVTKNRKNVSHKAEMARLLNRIRVIHDWSVSCNAVHRRNRCPFMQGVWHPSTIRILLRSGPHTETKWMSTAVSSVIVQKRITLRTSQSDTPVNGTSMILGVVLLLRLLRNGLNFVTVAMSPEQMSLNLRQPVSQFHFKYKTKETYFWGDLRIFQTQCRRH